MNIRYPCSFFLTLTFSFYCPSHAMENESNHSKESPPLNWIEREIFIASIHEDGMDCMRKKVDKMKTIKDFYIIIDLDLYPNHKNNVLSKMIYEKIKTKEKKDPYRTKTVKENNVIHEKNNFLGNYTEYWHKQDEQNKNYIRCIAIFTKKETIEDVFIPLENAFKKEAAKILLLLEQQLFSPKLIDTHSS